MSVDSAVLALFTHARRQHEGLSPRELESRLGLPARTVAAVERRGFVSAEAAHRLAEWNGLVEGLASKAAEEAAAKRPTGGAGRLPEHSEGAAGARREVNHA